MLARTCVGTHSAQSRGTHPGPGRAPTRDTGRCGQQEREPEGEVWPEAAGRGLGCYGLFHAEDLDLWLRHQDGPVSAGAVVSRLESVKGFEFDTVVVCDFAEGGRRPSHRATSSGVRPRSRTAMTRARDELVLTNVSPPSVFLRATVW